MANTFKVITDAAAPASAGSFDTVYTCPGSTTTVVLGLMLCNIHTSTVTASVKLTSSTSGGNPNTNQTVLLVDDVSIPNGSTLEVLSGSKVVLQTTDDLLVDCSVSAKLDVAISIMEIT